MPVLDRVIRQLLPEHVALLHFRGHRECLIEDLLLPEPSPLQVLVHLQKHALLVEAQLVLILVQLFHGFFALRVEIVIKLLVFVDITRLFIQEQRLDFLGSSFAFLDVGLLQLRQVRPHERKEAGDEEDQHKVLIRNYAFPLLDSLKLLEAVPAVLHLRQIVALIDYFLVFFLGVLDLFRFYESIKILFHDVLAGYADVVRWLTAGLQLALIPALQVLDGPLEQPHRIAEITVKLEAEHDFTETDEAEQVELGEEAHSLHLQDWRTAL